MVSVIQFIVWWIYLPCDGFPESSKMSWELGKYVENKMGNWMFAAYNT
jgi:hypothetical protein